MSVEAKTILNIKTDKKLKKSAKETADELGIPLSTAINAFLKQFVREKEITLSANKFQPTSYLQRIVREARREFLAGKTSGPFYDAESLIKHLKSL